MHATHCCDTLVAAVTVPVLRPSAVACFRPAPHNSDRHSVPVSVAYRSRLSCSVHGHESAGSRRARSYAPHLVTATRPSSPRCACCSGARSPPSTHGTRTVVFQRHRQQPGFEFLQAYLDDVHQDGHLDVAKHQLEQREDALRRCRLLDACVARSSHLGRIGSWDHEMGQ